MLLPYLSETGGTSKKYNVIFRGLNYGEDTQEGEFADTYNLSFDKYPCMTQRAARIKTEQFTEKASAVHAKEGLLVIDGTKVYYDGVEVGGENTVAEGKKQTAAIGKYIVIFPDKIYYDVTEKKLGKMEEIYEGEPLTFTESTITTEGENFNFEKGDGVKIEYGSFEKTLVIQSKDDKKLTFLDRSFEAILADENATQKGKVTIEGAKITREVPELEFICENNYRLWGVKGNTIFASKYSSPMNFHVTEGLEGDSYSIEVSSDGDFTGCIPYSTHICFFKENVLHKLYGSKPSNYQITTASVYGVQSGCEKSMHIVNEQLLYKGVDGVYSYAGGIPELISDKFGTKRFSEAVASCDGRRYYISMKDSDDEWGLYVYDVNRELWLREDNTHVVDMTFYDGHVYFLDSSGGLYYVDREEDRSGIAWGATFCTMHETMNERKGYSKFHLRMSLEEGAWIAVDMKTDNAPQWQQVYATHNERARTVSIPILPTRCDSIDIRIRGEGECTIRSFIREFMTGSDV